MADTEDTSEVRTPAGVLNSSRGRELPDAETSRELLRQMALIRRFEEEAGRQYQRAKAGGFLHLAIGEEATIVGTTSVMEPDDYLIGTYRTHGHAIARGTDPKNVMAELFGREDGTARGRGGSMHIFDGDRRFMGGYGIVGGNLPIAAGLALASDYKGTDEVTVCMFGDGASNTGNFGETMNLAALWRLPIVFLVENNLYGMGTAIERHSAVTDLSRKAEGLGVPGERVDGQDVVAIRECVTDHLEIARRDRRPTLVEAFTYRYRGHSAADPEVYRDKQEVEEWQRRDPIEIFARRLIDAGSLGEDDLEVIREEVDREVVAAVEFADASPEPPLDSLYDNLYVLAGQHEGWFAVDERTPDAFRGEREREAAADDRVRELHEAGASYGGQNPRSGGGSGEGPVTETDAPADQAQAEEKGAVDAEKASEQSEQSRQQGPGGVG
ncbi:MAG TPA: pyruvate dehydrogenase (acetyl-transferring) E1 component subunit alpha [Solirubrobacterales bacterium]|nr:pyruvate dehydrogenase (acetyl-transferring) E1 component subunit alpha [Solirubrobacterales bacterium]